MEAALRLRPSATAAPTLHLVLTPPLALGTKATEAALRLGPSATEGQSQARRRRQRLPFPPHACCLAPSPPSSAHRPATLRTHLPLPSRLRCTVGARPAAQGGRALALPPPVPTSASKAGIRAPKGAPWRDALVVPVTAALASWPLPSLAAAESDGKVSLESIVVAIDDFNNRNPFFVAGVVFVWLVVIPLVQEYVFKKYKPVSSIDAFRKLRDVPEAQLLDIRRGKSVRFMAPPNLKLVDKSTVQVEFDEEDDKGFVKEVLARFPDPANTVVCVLDNFDGNSLKVAELLVENGFKEAYAIKGGLRGPEGWQAVQENYLPPSVHVFPRKKKGAKLAHTDASNDGTYGQQQGSEESSAPPSRFVVNTSDESKDVYENSNGSTTAAKHATRRPLSPYPNYPDLKPPSSPTPSKPTK